MKNQKKIFALLFTLLLAISMSVSSITTVDTYAASKKYTKTYSLKRNYKKTVKLKSKIKSVKSSNKKVVTVKKSGKKFTITTKKKGTAIITVKCKNKKTYKYKVKVSNKKHKHAWTTEEWTETVTTQERVNYYCCGSCSAAFLNSAEVEAHQETTGKDGICLDCGNYIANCMEHIEYNPENPTQWRNICPACEGCNIERKIKHHGWHNDWRTVDVVTTVTHHRRVCGCGAVENID